MKKRKVFKNIFTSNIIFSDNVSYGRIIMVNVILLVMSLTFFLFTFFNLFLTHNYFLVFMDIIATFLSFGTFFLLRKNQNIRQVALIATSLLIIYIILYTLDNASTHIGIIWTVFPPLLSILLNGKRVGLAFTLLFYSIIFSLAYLNLGIWDNGNWNHIDLFRFIAASSLLTLLIYVAESAREQADEALAIIRKREAFTLKKLEKLAITDALTGMYNRRYFNEVVPKILKTSQRNNTYISMFILDIDYFKNYNDYYGHQAGDRVLKRVAKALKEYIQRENDFVCRIGGEEFAGIIQTKDIAETKEWISQLNQVIETLQIEHKMTLLDPKILTVSIGLCIEKVTKGIDLDYLYSRADKALYQAKERGRNRTIIFEADDAQI